MLRYKNSLLERILVEKGKGKQVKVFQDESELTVRKESTYKQS